MRAAEVKPYTMHVKVVDLFCPLISLQIWTRIHLPGCVFAFG
jgi:hypothetical protein